MRSKIIEIARSYLGCPYHHAGRKRTGLDCAGLLVLGYQEMGWPYHDCRNYSLAPNGNLERILDRQLVIEEPQPGSWLMFAQDVPGVGQHLALKTFDDTIVHANRDAGQVIETSIPASYESLFIKAYGFKEYEWQR